jgi:hypothetical protein
MSLQDHLVIAKAVVCATAAKLSAWAREVTRLRTSSEPLATSETSEPKGGFELFSNLPPELQLKIWALALPGARVVEVKAKRVKKTLGRFRTPPAAETIDPKYWYLTVLFEPIALMSVCRDSRAVALKYYQLSFGRCLKHPIYFDNSRDIILGASLDILIAFCNWSNDGSSISEDGVRYLAVDPLHVYNLSTKTFHKLPRSWSVPRLAELVTIVGSLKEVYILDLEQNPADMFRVLFVVKLALAIGRHYVQIAASRVPADGDSAPVEEAIPLLTTLQYQYNWPVHDMQEMLLANLVYQEKCRVSKLQLSSPIP